MTHSIRHSVSLFVIKVCLCAAQEALEQELRDEAAKGQLQLDDAAREEYNRIKQDAGAKTSKLAQDLASLQTTQKARRMCETGKLKGTPLTSQVLQVLVCCVAVQSGGTSCLLSTCDRDGVRTQAARACRPTECTRRAA